MSRPPRASKARAVALNPVPPSGPPTMDDLAAELGPTVFRLLDHWQPHAAAALVATYRDAADAALWRELLAGPPTGQLAVTS